MSIATTLSRVTGFIRTWAMGLALGTTVLAASYDTANNIPNMIFELVAGGILSSLFIPTFLEIRERRSESDSWRFASHVFNLSVIALGVIAILGTLFPQPFIWTQTFRMSAEKASQVRPVAEFFFRVFAVQVVLYGAGMVIQGLLNAQRRYLWTALGPVFNNVIVIATMFIVAAIGAATRTGEIVLAAGTTLGVLAMFVVMLPDLKRSGVRYYPQLGLDDPDVRRMLTLAVPTIVYVVTNLVTISFRNASAFAVASNGPAILRYAWNFYQLPYGILAVALATAVFTELSATAGAGDMTAFKKHFVSGLRTTGVLILPSAAALFVLAEPLVSLYRVGAFTQSSVGPVSSALRFWAISLVFFAAMMFVLRTFYALKDTKTPAIANLGLSVVQIALYTVLTTGMLGWKGLGVDGIPITDAIFYALMLVALTLLLRRKIGGFDLKAVFAVFLKMFAASVVGGALAYGTITLLGGLPGVGGSLIQVFSGGIVCFTVALIAGHLFGVAEVGSAVGLLGRVFSRFRNRRAS